MENTKRKDELTKIRKEREKLTNEINGSKKEQLRRCELIEYADGTFALKGFAYSLPLKKGEVMDALEAWINHLLEKGSLLET